LLLSNTEDGLLKGVKGDGLDQMHTKTGFLASTKVFFHPIAAYGAAFEMIFLSQFTDEFIPGEVRQNDVTDQDIEREFGTKLEREGLHTIMWKWSPSDTFTQLAEIWNGSHPEDGQELVVRDGMPPGFPVPDLEEEPRLSAPGAIDPEMLRHTQRS
jgi:Mn-containing catalase